MRAKSINSKIQTIVDQLIADGYEKIPYEYYYYKTLPAGAIPTQIEFFHQVVGQSDGSMTLTEEDTNMEKQSDFAYPFLAQNISHIILPSRSLEAIVQEIDTAGQDYNIKKAIVNDIYKLYNSGVVKLNVQSKELFKVSPLMRIPSGVGVSGDLSISSSKSDSSKIYVGGLLMNGEAGRNNKFPIEIMFAPNTKFTFTLQFPKGTITTYNDLRIGFILEGILFRKS
ncbi:MAG: hypothetical protein GYA62_04190 [Bacteroidales bacterium]|nr:hypothetical protein [Bacteroidales bacterium]